MDREQLSKIFRDHWWQIALMSVGLGLMTTGIVLAQKETRGEELIIVEPSPSAKVLTQVVVDVEGAVENSGIYHLESGSRVGEAIVMAGGLSATADRSFVARFINQAEVVRDGMKLYIPSEGESVASSQVGPEVNGVSTGGMVSINMASEAELDSLWGIGVARAKTIIENRPYSSLDELVTKAKITQEVLDKNQGKIGL